MSSRFFTIKCNLIIDYLRLLLTVHPIYDNLYLFHQILNNLSCNDQSCYRRHKCHRSGISLRSVHLCAAPGGQIQWLLQNIYVIQKANVGFAKYIASLPEGKERGVAIGYDNRHMSYKFAIESAKVLATYEIGRAHV